MELPAAAVATTRERAASGPWASQPRRRAIAAHCPARPGIDRRSSACRSMRPWSRGPKRQRRPRSVVTQPAVHTEPAGGGPQRAPAVTGQGTKPKTAKPQSGLHSGTAKYESSHPLPRALRAPAYKAADHQDRPHPTVELEPTPPGASILLLAAVPPACHKQRSLAVSSGQSRSLRQGRWTGRPPLTWTGRGAGNCMACKGSRLGSALPCPAGRSVPVAEDRSA